MGRGRGGVFLFDKLFDSEYIICGYAVQATQCYQMLDRQFAFAAFIFTVLFLPGVQDKGDLFLCISVFYA